MLPVMSLWHAIALGLLQGFTEFLPVSSTGHLALAEIFFELPVPLWDLQGFDVLLHAASLLALLICTGRTWVRLLLSLVRRDRPALRLLFLLIIGTIPAALLGFFFEEFFVKEFRSVPALAVQLLLSGLVLSLADRARERGSIAKLSIFQSIFIGAAQASALVPGLSRSGMTVAAGRAVGLSRSEAFEFSFLLAAPAIAGAVLLTGFHIANGTMILPSAPISMAGFVASLLSSIIAVQFLRSIATKVSLHWFTAYLVILACVLLLPFLHLERFSDPLIARAVIHRYGSIVLFLFALVETVPPLSFFSPGVVVLVMGGALAGSILPALLFLAAATGGIVFGNTFFYLLGKRYGKRVAGRFAMTRERLDHAERFMKRFGTASLLLGQFSGAIRPVISFLAGTLHFSRVRFALPMFLGAVIFSSVLLSIGFLFQKNLAVVLPLVSFSGIGLLLLAVFLGWIFSRMTKGK